MAAAPWAQASFRLCLGVLQGIVLEKASFFSSQTDSERFEQLASWVIVGRGIWCRVAVIWGGGELQGFSRQSEHQFLYNVE